MNLRRCSQLKMISNQFRSVIEILQYSYYPKSFYENLSCNQNLFSTLQRSCMFHDFLFQCEAATVLKLQHLSLVAIFIFFLCGRYIVWPVNVDTFNFHIRIVQSSWKKIGNTQWLDFFSKITFSEMCIQTYTLCINADIETFWYQQ
jgi:hypothetical protein